MSARTLEPITPASTEARPDRPLRAILRLAAPMTAFFLIQSLVNLVSLAVLGRLGDAALAGVGAASALFGVVMALLFGIDAAAQAIASRLTGAGQGERLGEVLADALAVSLPLGAALAAAMWFGGPVTLHALLKATAAKAVGAAWIRAAAPALVFFAATIPFNACWIASGRPARPFLVTALLAPVQIGATLALVFGAGPLPAQGAVGAGEAMTLTALAGVGVQVLLAARAGGVAGFPRAAPRLDGALAIAALGWPISLQQSLLQLGLMAAFVIVSRLGVAAVAVVNVLITLTTVPAQMAVGLGVAAATLVGQSLGRGDTGGARAWGWRAALAGAAVAAPLGLAAMAAPEALLGPFLRDPATLALAVWPARLVGAGVVTDAVGRILSFALRGAGATRTSAAIPFAGQWIVQLPLTWWAALGLGFGLVGLAAVQAGVAAAEALVTALVWSGASWTSRSSTSRTAARTPSGGRSGTVLDWRARF